MMMFRPIIKHLVQTGSNKDDSGLGRWVVMTVNGDGCAKSGIQHHIPTTLPILFQSKELD